MHEKGKGSIAEICGGGGKIFDLVETQQEDQSSFLFCLSFLPSPDLRCRHRVCFLLGTSSAPAFLHPSQPGMARTWPCGWKGGGGKSASTESFVNALLLFCVLFEEMIRVYFIARKGCQPL